MSFWTAAMAATTAIGSTTVWRVRSIPFSSRCISARTAVASSGAKAENGLPRLVRAMALSVALARATSVEAV